MPQYLLSLYQPDGGAAAPEVLEEISRFLDALNQELRAAGAWVFAGGLHSPSTATVVRLQDGEVAEVQGPEAALALVDGLDLGGYHLFHAIRADLLRRLGRNPEAALAYQKAIVGTHNAAERDFLQRSRQALTPT
jgi:hypothetical protein